MPSRALRYHRQYRERIVMSYIGCLRSRTVISLVISILAIVASGCGRAKSQEPVFPVQDSDVPRILVMPFENLGTPDDAFFATGLTKETTRRLAAVRGLGFVSRVRVAEDEPTSRSAETVGRELGVDFVLSGSVLYDRDAEPSQQLYVETELLRVSDGSIVWADRVVRPLSDVFSIQSSISHAVVDNIGIEVDSAERRALDTRPTENLEAYEAYLRGLAYCWSFELKKLQRAEEHLSRAVTLDPNFAVAHAALSENHSLMFHFHYDLAPQRLASANAAAQRAHDIDADLPEGHRARGYYYYWGQRNYELALSEFSFAARSRPNDPQIVASIGLVLRRQGRWQEAIDALRRAAAMEPENHDTVLDLASTLSRVRRYNEAVESCQRAIELVPDDIYPYVFLARTLMLRDGAVEEARETLDAMPDKDPAQQGFYRHQQAMFERDFDGAMNALAAVDDVISDPIGDIRFTKSLAVCESRIVGRLGSATSPSCFSAREYLERAREDSPGDPAIHAALGWAYALTGEKEMAIEAGQRAVELSPITADAISGHSYLVMLAKIYAWVDEPYLAVKTIHTAMSTPGWISVATLELDPDWDPIRHDPRFQELLRMHGAIE
jgi:TolB-like protein/tetratricopeptide (TPR) repeat protein